MAESVAVDTNIIVRYLTGDDKRQSPVAANLFRAAQDGKIKLVVPASVIQETVYVLETEYSLAASDIGSKLVSLLAIPNVHAPDAGWLAEALQSYRTRNCDFGDALLCAFANAEGCDVTTFDKGIPKRFPEVTAFTPDDVLAGKARGGSKGDQN